MAGEYEWDDEKNAWLRAVRGISFERAIYAIETENLLDVVSHPNAERYPGQRIYVVDIEGYVYLVPYVVTEEGNLFLKTVTPSRKATRDYLRRGRP